MPVEGGKVATVVKPFVDGDMEDLAVKWRCWCLARPAFESRRTHRLLGHVTILLQAVLAVTPGTLMTTHVRLRCKSTLALLTEEAFPTNTQIRARWCQNVFGKQFLTL